MIQVLPSLLLGSICACLMARRSLSDVGSARRSALGWPGHSSSKAVIYTVSIFGLSVLIALYALAANATVSLALSAL
jgi:hypothetical protein